MSADVHEIPTLPSFTPQRIAIGTADATSAGAADDEAGDRPTLPSVPRSEPFVPDAVQFFLDGDEGRSSADDPEPDVAAWWQEQRRRSYVRFVVAAMVACGALLGLASSPLFP